MRVLSALGCVMLGVLAGVGGGIGVWFLVEREPEPGLDLTGGAVGAGLIAGVGVTLAVTLNWIAKLIHQEPVVTKRSWYGALAVLGTTVFLAAQLALGSAWSKGPLGYALGGMMSFMVLLMAGVSALIRLDLLWRPKPPQ